jgi:hypothetical protein
MLARLVLTAALTLALALPASSAPRDEALRLTPSDFAITVVIQNLRDHSTAVMESSFAEWFPTTAYGKHFLASADVKKFTESGAPILAALNITPTDLFHDIIGDVVVFAYAPASATSGERSIILARPRKFETLVKVVNRLNELQTQSKELKGLLTHKYAGETYYERQKPQGPSDFYCFRDGVFAFSGSEAEIKAVIDRDKTTAKDKPSELVTRMTKLGVADAAAVLLIHPRALDAELAAKVKNAKPEEKGFLTKFAEVWSAAEAAAVYLALDTGAEVGLSLQFNPEKLQPGPKAWLVGDRTPSALWSVIPDNAMLAVAGRVKVNDLLDFLAGLNTAQGNPNVRENIEQALGPIVGRDKLPLVLDALGPDWGVWVLPPAPGSKDTAIPVVVGAVKVQAGGEKGEEASKALVQSLEYGFQVARITYNAKHKDQIELREEKDGDVVIKSLAGDGLPAGFRPCFALKGGYLVVSTSPDAIKSFRAPTADAKPGGDVPLVRFNATATRAYLTSHAPALAKFLASAGASDGNEKAILEQIGGFAAILEPMDKVELLTRGDATGLKVMLRVKTAKPLKK